MMAQRQPTRTGVRGLTERRELFDGQGRIVFEGHRIGGGGMGAVYAGWCEGGGGGGILKEYRTEDYDETTLANAMTSECRVLRDLALRGYPAPRLLAQGDYRAGRQGLWFLMTRAPGIQLDAWMKSHVRAPLGKKLALLKKIADAIEKLHQLGIVHLDLKPANIFVDDRGRGGPAVELIDFGNARSLSRTAAEAREEPMLTPGYASPEHFEGLASCREAADNFVLGVLCTEVLTGALPFNRADGRKALLEGDRRAVKARLRANGVAEDLAEFIAGRLLAVDSGQRGPGTADELSARLGKESKGWGDKWWVWCAAAGVCGLAIVLFLKYGKKAPPTVGQQITTIDSTSTNSQKTTSSRPKIYTNNSPWPVAFTDRRTTNIVERGGTIATNWYPIRAKPGKQVGDAWGLVEIQPPMVELRYSANGIQFIPPQGVRTTPKKLDGGLTVVSFPLSNTWTDKTDEWIQNTIQKCVSNRQGFSEPNFVWDEERFVAGRTKVLVCDAAPLLAAPASVHTNNSPWTVAFSDGMTTNHVPPGGAIGTNWIPVGAELGDTFGGGDARIRVLNLRTVQPPTVELSFSENHEFRSQLKQISWQTDMTGSLHAQLPETLAKYPASQLKSILENGVQPKSGLNRDDYDISARWSAKEFVAGMTNTLTVTATRKPDVVNELKNENRFTILVDGEELNAGDVIQLASWPPKPLAVKDDHVNQWACTIVSPDNVSTVRGTTNTYTVAVQENPKPIIVVTNSGPVPVFFDWNGREQMVAVNESLRLESDGLAHEFVFRADSTDANYANHLKAYDWAPISTTAAPKYGKTQTLDSALKKKEKQDVQLVLDASQDGSVEVSLSGTRHWLDLDGKTWHLDDWSQRPISLKAGAAFSTNIPWLNVWKDGVNVEWKATGYKTPPSTNIVFREAGDKQSIALALQLESQTVAVTNTNPIPVVVWLMGQRGRKTILPNKDASFSWTPTSASAKAPQICYQPAPTLDTNSWGIWGFKMGEIKTNTVIRIQPDSETVKTYLKNLQEQMNSCPEIHNQSGRWMWSTSTINELKALRGCGLTTNDVKDASWPTFSELNEKLQNYLKMHDSERIQNVRNLVKDASDWDDFMNLPTGN